MKGPLNLAVIGFALGLFGAITFALCVVWDLALPAYSMVFVPLYNRPSRRIEGRPATGGMRHA